MASGDTIETIQTMDTIQMTNMNSSKDIPEFPDSLETEEIDDKDESSVAIKNAQDVNQKTLPLDNKHKNERERKIGHRRVGVGGEITYKKIQTTQIMGSIQLGIQHAVGGLASKPERDLLMQDFMTVETTNFPSEGSNHTPAHHYSEFKFKNYAPIAFRYFRDLFGIQPDDFLMSMCNTRLRELSNPGASGSIFYVTADDEFIIKTVQHKEGEFLQKLLAGYYMNLNQNPRTLLPKFFGLYCFQCNSKNVRLVVMNNLLPSSITMHQKYDLKGSTYKRKASKAERAKRAPTYKDLDFMEHHPEGILMEADTYNALTKTIQRDCRVLESFKIMDYSLLLAIHNLDQAQKEKMERKSQSNLDRIVSEGQAGDTSDALLHEEREREKEDRMGAAGSLNRSKSINRQRLVAHSTAMESIQAESEPIDEDDDTPPGGIPARNTKGERLLLFIGIIDILQSYRLKKKLEHTWKSMIHDGDTVSVHRPSFYAQRFQKFMSQTVFKKIPSLLDGTAKKKPIAFAVKDILPWSKNRISRSCTKKVLCRRLPILTWLPRYNASNAAGDFIAGITVGLTLIPQGLAYYSIVGLPPQYGLYSSFIGCFIYIIFGSCKDVPFGPSALNALLTAQAVDGKGPEHAILLSFLTGTIQILMGIFGLGFIINFVSGPVSSGFTSAVSMIIITSQVKDILGIKPKGGTFVETWNSILHEIPNIRIWDTVMGVSCITLLLIMKTIGSQKIGSDEEKPTVLHKLFNTITWFIGTGRNVILVVICAFIGYIYCEMGEPPFLVIGNVPQGLPAFKPPPFGMKSEVNGTVVEYTFVEMLSNLGSGIIIVPLVGLMENIAICKAFADGKGVDATQELLALGFCNIGNSFVQGYPGTGALGRSAVNNASGVRTPLGGLYTGILVIAALLFFTKYFYYIPNAVLGAVIIAATIFMIEVKVVKPMWKSKKSCFIIFLVTFVACLVLHLEVGILVGIGINLLLILYHAARPKINVDKLQTSGGVEYLLLTPDRCLIFPSADYVRHIVTKYGVRQGIPVVIDCSHIYGADYTAATVIEILIADFAAREQRIFFYNLKPSVCSVFEGLSPKGFVVFYNNNDLDDLIIKYGKEETVNTAN